MRLQGHQIDDIDDADLQVGNVTAQQIDRSERFQGRNIAGASHHDVGFAAAVIAGPFPDADPGVAMLDCGIDVEPLGLRLLAGDDDIDAVPAPQAMIGDPEQ